MSLFSRIAKKISRRFRRKGTARVLFDKKPMKHTAQTLWESTHSFSNPEPARAGVKRSEARLAQKAKRLAARHGINKNAHSAK